MTQINLANLTKEEKDELFSALKYEDSQFKRLDREYRIAKDIEKEKKEAAKEAKEKRFFWFKTIAMSLILLGVLSFSGGMINSFTFKEATGLTPTQMYQRNLQKASERTESYQNYDAAASVQKAFDSVYVPAN